MHILIIPSEEFLPPSSHLAGIFQYHQAKALMQAGHRVSVLSVSQSLSVPMILKAMFHRLLGKPLHRYFGNKGMGELAGLLFRKMFRPSAFITRETIDGIPVFRVEGFYFFPPNKHTNHLGWIAAGFSLWKTYLQEQGRPDLLHAHNAVYGGMLARKIGKATRIPYLVTEHSSFLMRNLESPLIQGAIRRSMESAAIVLPVSPALETALHRLYGEGFRSKALPNVLDPMVESAPLPLQGMDTRQPFTFLCIATMVPLKRHKDLIDAFAGACSQQGEVKLLIGGDGDLMPALKKQAADLRIDDRVVFLGKLDREQVIENIDRCHCLVLTSEVETFGVVLIEALSRGKPLIASACGGPEGIIHDGNGFLYQIGDTQGLASAMQKMKAQWAAFKPEQLRKEALERYGKAAFVAQLESVYREINA